ncbi:MAG: fibronectin type III domain-containing protein, partial [Bacteroidales bacterium]
MKNFSALLVCIITIAFSAHAQNKPYSIITCPGEDASRQMNISWASDTSQKADYVIYTIAKDVNWKRAKNSSGESHLCKTFDG